MHISRTMRHRDYQNLMKGESISEQKEEMVGSDKVLDFSKSRSGQYWINNRGGMLCEIYNWGNED